MLVKKQHGKPPNPAALRPSGRVGRGALHFALNAQGRVGRGWGVSPADLTTDPLSGKEPEPSAPRPPREVAVRSRIHTLRVVDRSPSTSPGPQRKFMSKRTVYQDWRKVKFGKKEPRVRGEHDFSIRIEGTKKDGAQTGDTPRPNAPHPPQTRPSAARAQTRGGPIRLKPAQQAPSSEMSHTRPYARAQATSTPSSRSRRPSCTRTTTWSARRSRRPGSRSTSTGRTRTRASW